MGDGVDLPWIIVDYRGFTVDNGITACSERLPRGSGFQRGGLHRERFQGGSNGRDEITYTVGRQVGGRATVASRGHRGSFGSCNLWPVYLVAVMVSLVSCQVVLALRLRTGGLECHRAVHGPASCPVVGAVLRRRMMHNNAQ